MSGFCRSRWTLLAMTLLLASGVAAANGQSPTQDAGEPIPGAWYAAGPFSTSQFDEVLPPERAVDLQAVAGGVPLWQRHDDWPDELAQRG